MSADPSIPTPSPAGPPVVPSASRPVPPVQAATDRIARAYQPRRVRGAAVSVCWNLALAAVFLFSGSADRLFVDLAEGAIKKNLLWVTPVYLIVYFGGWAVLNFPLELWQGYMEERQFGLAKDGIRAWSRNWIMGTLQHGIMFVTGSWLLLAMQRTLGPAWVLVAAGTMLLLVLGTAWLAIDLIPPGMFDLQRADAATMQRLERLLAGTGVTLPPVMIYSHASLREFAGGLIGLGNRQFLMISRSTLQDADDDLLRFVLLHDMGHRHFRHNLLSALAGWAWSMLGLVGCDAVIEASRPDLVHGSPIYIAYLALGISLWMALGQPILAYLGRRLEYQADRFYLRSGGTYDQMRRALMQLAGRNLARTERLRRRQSFVHPLPSVANRLFAARQYVKQLQATGGR